MKLTSFLATHKPAAGLVAAVQAAHDDLKAQQGAVLVTGAGLALETDETAAAAASVAQGMANLVVAKAAQRKLVHIMHKALAPDGIYVAEVTVLGGVSWKPMQASSLRTDVALTACVQAVLHSMLVARSCGIAWPPCDVCLQPCPPLKFLVAPCTRMVYGTPCTVSDTVLVAACRTHCTLCSTFNQ